MILRQAIVSGFDWVDLETDIADEIQRFRDVKRIVSYHNFTETPDDLETIYERMTQQDADVLKIVTMAQHPKDCLRVLNLIQERQEADGRALHGRHGRAEPDPVAQVRGPVHLRGVQQGAGHRPRACRPSRRSGGTSTSST